MVELASYWDGHGHESYKVRLLGSQHPTGPAAMYWVFLLFLPSGPLGRGEGEGGESWRQESIKKDRQCPLVVQCYCRVLALEPDCLLSSLGLGTY